MRTLSPCSYDSAELRSASRTGAYRLPRELSHRSLLHPTICDISHEMRIPQHVTFTMSEVGSITGVDEATLRDWRRRKLLPPRQLGHGTYSLTEIAYFVAVQETLGLRIPIRMAVKLADRASVPIASNAVLSWLLKRERDDEAEEYGGPSFLLAHGGGTDSEIICLYNDVSDFFDDFESEPRPSAALVLDLVTLGQQIAERVYKPLLVEAQDDG